MALKIGITGGIGCGKTTICQAFEVLGVPVFYADKEAKKILATDIETHIQLYHVFGDEIFTNNKPDRSKIAAIVFNNSEKLNQLNAIIHPKVRENFANWSENQQHHPYIIQEAAILFESNLWKQFDYSILVIATLEQRVARVMKRDNTSEQAVLQRISNQWTDDEKAKLASFIISNNENDKLLPQLLIIHKQLLSLSTHG